MRVYCKINGKLAIWDCKTPDHQVAIESVEHHIKQHIGFMDVKVSPVLAKITGLWQEVPPQAA